MGTRGGRSRDVQRFYDVNKRIKGMLEGADMLGKFSWREYAGLYRWVPELDDMLSALEKTHPQEVLEYLNNVHKNGLYRMTEAHLDEEGGRRNRVLFRPNNGPLERQRAVEFLKKTFYELEAEKGCRRGVVSENVKGLIQQGIDGCSSVVAGGSKISSRSFFQEELKKAGDYGRCWDLLAGILIYALTGQLPENEYKVAENRFPALHTNIFMGTKEEIQKAFSLESRYQGASLLVVVNYAGTSFLTGKKVVDSPDYEASDDYDDWNVWFYNMLQGRTKIRVVLTDPESAAAVDAAKYKMKPQNLKCDSDQIIPLNIQALKSHMAQFPDCDFKAYLTEVDLPCAYIKAEFEDPTLDNIKVDLYLPNYTDYERDEAGTYFLEDPDCSDDTVRQSFMVFRKDTPELYESFSANIDAILAHAKELD